MTELRISGLAEASGVPAATLRYYETIGLLAPARDPNGYRRYDERHVERLRFIGRAKQLGLQLDQIRELLDLRADGVCPPVRGKLGALVTEKLAQTRHSIDELNRFAAELGSLADRITAGDPPPLCGEGCGCPDQPFESFDPSVLIACALPSGQRDHRVRDWRSLAAVALRVEATDTGWRLHLPDRADVVGGAAALAAPQRRCCAFLTFALTLSGEGLVLDVHAPSEARGMIRDLFEPAVSTNRARPVHSSVDRPPSTASTCPVT